MDATYKSHTHGRSHRSMIRTDGSEEKGNGDSASCRTCNGNRKLHRGNSACNLDMHQCTTIDKHVTGKKKKEPASCCGKEDVGKGGIEKRVLGSDVYKVLECLPHGRRQPVVDLDIMRGRAPAMHDGSTNDGFSSMIHPKEKNQQSPDGKNDRSSTKGMNDNCSVIGGSTICSSTKLPSAGTDATSSPNGHVHSSPPKLEKEALPKHRNLKCTPPKTNPKYELSEKCGSSDLEELEKEKSADDKTKDLQKSFASRVCTAVTESPVDSVDVLKGNGCDDRVLKDKKSVEAKQSYEQRAKGSRNLSLSKLIERVQGTISGVKPNEDTGLISDSDESETGSTDDESESNVDSSQSSEDIDDNEDGADDDDDKDRGAGSGETCPSGREQSCPVESTVTCPGGQSGETEDDTNKDRGAQSGEIYPSDKGTDEPGEKLLHSDDHQVDGLLALLPTRSVANSPNTSPVTDEPDSRLKAHGPQADGLLESNAQQPSRAKVGPEEKVDKLIDGGFIMDCGDVETIESDKDTADVEMTEKETLACLKDSSLLQQQLTKPMTQSLKDLSTKPTSSSNSYVGKIGEGVKSGDGEVDGNVYSVFEKPAPLTKKRAAAFASSELDRYLAKHNNLQKHCTKGDPLDMTSKTNSYLEKDVLQVDGITFVSFPTREMLKMHITQKKETVRYVDTATMLQQKWGSNDAKVEPTPASAIVSPVWQKTDDVRKIKGWKKRLLSTDDSAAPAVEVTVSCKSEKLHWKSEEKLVRMLTAEQLKDMGLKLKHKRRRHTPYTQSKHHTTTAAPPGDVAESSSTSNVINISQEEYPTNYGDIEYDSLGEKHPSVGKIYGRKSDGKFAPKRRKDKSENSRKRLKTYSGLLTGSPSSVKKFQTMLDRKNLSVGLSSKFCSNIETAQKFRIVDNQLTIASDTEEEPGMTQHKMDSERSENVPEGLRRLETVELTRSMALKAVSSLMQTPRALCKKPGCRYSCVCHLCEVVSTDDGDTMDQDLVTVKTCNEEYCRLGCICDSAPGASTRTRHGNEGWSVLDTSVDSSLDNTWSFADGEVASSCNISSDIPESRCSTGNLAQKRHGSRERELDSKKRCSTSDIPIIPREGFSQELAALLIPSSATGSAAAETTSKAETVPNVRKSSRLKDKCGIGIVDRLKSLIYFDTALWLQDDKPRRQKKQPRRQQQLPEQRQQKQQQQQQQQTGVKGLDCDGPVACDQENIIMVELSSDDDDEIVASISSGPYSKKKRNKKVETVEKLPATVVTSGSPISSSCRKFTKSVSKMAPTGFSTQMVVLERKSKHSSARGQSNTERSPSSVLPHLLEIESDCNWQKGRFKILSDISRLADSCAGYLQPVTFQVGRFVVSILEKPHQPTNIPPHLQKSLNTKQMFAIRIRITEAPDDVSSDQFGISTLQRLKVSLSGHVIANKRGVNMESSGVSSQVFDMISKEDTDENSVVDDCWPETNCGIATGQPEMLGHYSDRQVDCSRLIDSESGFSSTLPKHYRYTPPKRIAQVEEARMALEEARRTLTKELAKVKKERKESFEASNSATETVPPDVKEEQSKTMPLIDPVKEERKDGSLLKGSPVRPVPMLVPAPHVRSPSVGGARHPVVPVGMVQNVAHAMHNTVTLLDDTPSEMTGATSGFGYDGCDDPVTDTSCHDDRDTPLDRAMGDSSFDDLLLTDTSSLDNLNGMVDDSSSNGFSVKSEGDAESCDNSSSCLSENLATSMIMHEYHRKTTGQILSDRYPGVRVGTNAGKVPSRENDVHSCRERVRRSQLSDKFEKLRRLVHPKKLPGHKVSKQVILSMAVTTIHNVCRANKSRLEQKEAEMHRQAKLIRRLKELGAELDTPGGDKTSQKVAPQKHRRLPDRHIEDAANEVYAISSESSGEEDVCDDFT